MPFGGFERHGGTQQPMAEINVTPLVDVMLVLLVIFIITAPLLSYAIRLDLPNDPAPAADVVPATVRLSIDAGGQVYWESDARQRRRVSRAARRSLPAIAAARTEPARRQGDSLRAHRLCPVRRAAGWTREDRFRHRAGGDCASVIGRVRRISATGGAARACGGRAVRRRLRECRGQYGRRRRHARRTGAAGRANCQPRPSPYRAALCDRRR